MLLTQKGSPPTDSLTRLPAVLMYSLEVSCLSSFSSHALFSYCCSRYIKTPERPNTSISAYISDFKAAAFS